MGNQREVQKCICGRGSGFRSRSVGALPERIPRFDPRFPSQLCAPIGVCGVSWPSIARVLRSVRGVVAFLVDVRFQFICLLEG